MRTHIVFTNGRSGSNFLVDAINQHPELCNYGEVLGSYMPSMKLHRATGYGGRSVEDYLDHVLTSRRHFEIASRYSAVARRRRGQAPRAKRWSDLSSIGVKDFGIRFAEHGLDDYLAHHPEISVISLYRENTLRRAVSVISLERTGQVMRRHGTATNVPLVIDPSELLALMHRMDRELDHQLQVVAGLDPERVLTIRYEDLFADSTTTAALVRETFEFLGVRPISIRHEQRKVLSDDLADTIDNADEVLDAVARSRFAVFLDERDPSIATARVASTLPVEATTCDAVTCDAVVDVSGAGEREIDLTGRPPSGRVRARDDTASPLA